MKLGNRRLIWIAASFLLVSTATRIGLALFSEGDYTLAEWIRFMGIGVIFDLVVMPCFLLPWALYEAFLPGFIVKHKVFGLWESRWASLWGAVFLSGFVVTAVSEFVFWEEFNARFNFIAVDYLIYTHEVINNIWQSYPIVLWVSAVLSTSFIVAWRTWPRTGGPGREIWTVRWARAVGIAVAIPLGMGAINQDLTESSSNVFVQQLSSNGPFSFGHAFQNNELDYAQYYPTLDADTLGSEIRTLTTQQNSSFIGTSGIKRTITASHARRDVNVVMISVESLSASFLGIFGDNQGLTPELDKLASKGLSFTNLYATGTRTVRGLEALTVGTPPIPGQSIVRRPDNDNLVNLGAELKKVGWNPYWIYGGYGFFDNMNAYYQGNGYAVVDRSDIDADKTPIHHETVWGVADEDLYSLAFTQLDQEYAKGNRFFAQIMTTSNHRPYTFPEDRIDLPQKKRESVVKYTDWAIGDFIRRSSSKPWFKNTLFIIVSDHTSKAAGKSDLPTWRYHIPMIWYAPDMIKPATMDRLMSQIDIPPTLMGWLGIDYKSSFFGYDIFNLEPGRERAFISTYQKLGYLKGGRLVLLDVNKTPEVMDGLPVQSDGSPQTTDKDLITEAITWYQSASHYFKSGLLKDHDSAAGN